mmetsp:Transcript_12256/g.27803  ORF Transcript_12256/g.27803 Transcript_12256/m.27803 type:complete len:122 (+) Transcript_12256:206-571(+)
MMYVELRQVQVQSPTATIETTMPMLTPEDSPLPPSLDTDASVVEGLVVEGLTVDVELAFVTAPPTSGTGDVLEDVEEVVTAGVVEDDVDVDVATTTVTTGVEIEATTALYAVAFTCWLVNS